MADYDTTITQCYDVHGKERNLHFLPYNEDKDGWKHGW